MSRADPLQLSLDGASMRRRTVNGASVTAAAQAIRFCLQMGTQLVLARLLDPAQFGLIAMVAPVLGLVIAISECGFGQAIVQRSDLTHPQLSSLFWISAGMGGALTLLAVLCAPLVAAFYAEPRTQWVTVALAGLILLSSVTLVPMALLNRQMRFTVLAAIEVTGIFLGVASGIASAWMGAGYWALVIMQTVNCATVTTLAWACCHWRPGRPAMAPGVGALIRFGAHILGSNLATYLSTSADQVIVGAVNGKVALGLYDRSYNLVVKPLMQLMAPASRVAVPLLSRLQDAPERYGRAYLMMLQLTTALCVPGLLAAGIAAEPLILLLLGPKWLAMAPVFFWISLGGVVSALSASTYWLFTTQSRSAEQMRFSVIVAVISVMAFGLGSLWGVVGVARVSALSFMFVQTPLLVLAATRRGPVTLGMVLRALLPLTAAGLAAAAVAVGVVRYAVGPPWLVLAATFTLAYAVFLLVLVLQPAGRQLVSNARAMLVERKAAA